MKRHALTLFGTILIAQLALAQNGGQSLGTKPPAPQQDELRFDLDFPGGTPADLVRGIEKATGHPINVIIPPESASVQLPPLKMHNAAVPEFFMALGESSPRAIRLPGGGISVMRYRFQSMGNDKNAVWFFRQDQSPDPQPVCRYYQLADLLNDYSIEDITTAIQTGWKLLKVEPQPQLKFHRETKLLIAVGQEAELATIDSVLSELRKMHGVPKPAKPAPKSEDSAEKK